MYVTAQTGVLASPYTCTSHTNAPAYTHAHAHVLYGAHMVIKMIENSTQKSIKATTRQFNTFYCTWHISINYKSYYFR